MWDPLEKISKNSLIKLLKEGPFDAVCWCQGINYNDNITNFNINKFGEIVKANAFLLELVSLKYSAEIPVETS